MSDNAIRVGDLVYISGYCCGDELVGTVHTVTTFHGSARCPLCNKLFQESAAELNEAGWGNLVRWLRRIPPLAELDEAERKESTPA